MIPDLETIDEASFESEVLGSQTTYVLEFTANWCPPCKALQPILQQILSEHRGQLRIGKIDIDTAPAIAARLGVRGAPTLVVFRNGQEVARQLGLTHKAALLKLLGLSRGPATAVRA
jgi:thioredoxin 1